MDKADSQVPQRFDEVPEHIPALGGVKGTSSARRYRGTGATQRYAALYHLASSELPYSTEWKAAANTPWTERMRPHFRDHLRFECRRYTRAGWNGRPDREPKGG